MKKIILIFIYFISFGIAHSQKFYLGNYLEPTPNEFELIGISTKTGVYTYKYKKDIYDSFFEREIGDIIVGIRGGIIVTTIYSLIPKSNDIGVPKDIITLIQESIPYPFKEINGVYGLNIDNQSISFARVKNELTFGKDRIMYLSSVKQSLLEQSKK
jgi:hypothetical protein